MVQSTASSVEEFLTKVPADRVPAIQRLRELCLEHLPGWEERMQWGMPGYGPSGSDALVSFNRQKGYISFYPARAALEPHRGKIRGASFGGGCIRFANPRNIDFEAISTMLAHVHRLKRQNRGEGKK